MSGSNGDVHLEGFTGMRVCVMERVVEQSQIGAFLGEAFTATATAIAEAGLHPVGPPVARYDMADGRFAVQAGFPVDGAGAVAEARLGEGLRLDEFPAGPVATLEVQGPYDQIPRAYQRISAWLGEHGYRPDGRPWEQYLDGPEVAEPRTVVQWPCAKT